ncbi:MAG: hypothetical protein HFJ80_06715 [Clostridiales bacterium]|nr:hypothetical protein [Clostridiales bacterium]
MPVSFPDAFIRRMQGLLASEWPLFLDAWEQPLRRGLRVNPLKCAPEQLAVLMKGRLTAPAPFAPHSYYVSEPHRAGADPLHHAGAYYMQEPSAMAAVTALSPRPGERVLDLCAAPGGKATQIAAALKGEGLLWCNEYVGARARVLCQNLERCGVRNAVVSSQEPAALAGYLSGFFDAVLADAPCSGEGMFRKEPAAQEQWSEDQIHLCAQRQEGILDSAARLLRPGGRLLYSTCTFAPEENELAIARFLSRHPEFVLEDLGGDFSPAHAFGRPAFEWERVAPFAAEGEADPGVPLSRCRRILPPDGGEGHFLALLRREGADTLPASVPVAKRENTKSNSFYELYQSCFSGSPDGLPVVRGERWHLIPESMPAIRELPLLYVGLPAADARKNRLEPCHALFMAANPSVCHSVLDLPLDDPRLAAFLRGEELPAPKNAGYTAVCAAGMVTGFGKVTGGRLKNRYPKGLRLLSR